MAMGDEQSCLIATIRKAQAEDHIIQAGFERLEERKTSDASLLQRRPVISPKLSFEHSVDPARFLLRPKLAGIIGFAPTPELAYSPVLAGRKRSAFDGTFGSETPIPFEEQFLSLPAAEFTNRTDISSHLQTSTF
jgi:hypothetical protein